MTTIRVLTESACIDIPFSSRLFLGEGLFETMRYTQQGVWASQHHWQRLSSSAADLNIPFTVSLHEWQEALHELVVQTNVDNGGIKAILMSGVAERGLDNVAGDSNLLLQTFAYENDHSPLRLIRSSWTRDAQNPVYRHKTINYLEAIQARRYAQRQGAEDVLFLDKDGYITETSTANIFMIAANRLYTPEQNGALLPGVSRALIMDCARSIGISVVEKRITMEDCLRAEAVFVCNALHYIRPVAELDGKPFSVEHRLYRRLMTTIEDFSPFK